MCYSLNLYYKISTYCDRLLSYRCEIAAGCCENPLGLLWYCSRISVGFLSDCCEDVCEILALLLLWDFFLWG